MTNVGFAVCVLLVMASHLAVAPPPPRGSPGKVGGARSLAQHGNCREGLEYLEYLEYLESPNICCLNCPAGEYMTSPCTKSGERGSCAQCASGTFTEHSNSVHKCLTCIRCRPDDEEEVRSCISTLNTMCQCKPGYFCIGDEACEVCKKCKRCEDGERTVKNCTAVANTECFRGLSTPGDSSTWVVWVILPVLAAAAAAIAFLVYKKWRLCLPYLFRLFPDLQSDSRENSQVHAAGHGSLEDRQNAQNGSVAFPLLHTEEPKAFNDDNVDLGLGESSSENSLGVQYILSPSPPASPVIPNRASPGTLHQPCARNDEDPQLVPLNGEQSLRKSFEYFYEMDLTYFKRFFRSLDVSDNTITNAKQDGDGIYELLVHWQEKEGREASLNHLLKQLRALKQNRTADEIKEKALNNGHYKLQVEE